MILSAIIKWASSHAINCGDYQSQFLEEKAQSGIDLVVSRVSLSGRERQPVTAPRAAGWTSLMYLPRTPDS